MKRKDRLLYLQPHWSCRLKSVKMLMSSSPQNIVPKSNYEGFFCTVQRCHDGESKAERQRSNWFNLIWKTILYVYNSFWYIVTSRIRRDFSFNLDSL